MTHTLGVILARAGSLGLRQKHLQPLLGRAVIEYTFDHARDAESLIRVVVSTDCPGVQRLASHRGLRVIQRPPELATADATVQDACIHAMDQVELATDFRVDSVVVLYGNVPIRGEEVIDQAVELLHTTGCDSVRSFCPVGKWHPAWMARLNGDRVEALEAGSIHRRQDLAPLYLHDGAVLAVSRSAMERGRRNPGDPHAFFGDDRRGIPTEPGETVEIDQLRDLHWAEAVLRDRQQLKSKVA